MMETTTASVAEAKDTYEEAKAVTEKATKSAQTRLYDRRQGRH